MSRLVLALALILVPGASVAQEVDATEPNRGGTLDLSAQDVDVAKSRLVTAPGYRVELFASEEDFDLHNPVSLTFDARGRLWVATMPSYPQRLPDQEPDDKILILEDTDGDGRADRQTVFADGLHLPTGFELGDGGVYVAQQPNLMFLRDTDGDDRADERTVLLHGFGTEDSHHSISAFTWGPAGDLYFQEGTFHHSQVETPYGPVRLVDAGVFRYKPNLYKLDVWVSYRFANPWGHVFDTWGQSFIADASGGANYFGTMISGNAPYPEKRRRARVFTSIVRPTSGCEFVSSRHFPDEAQGNFLINNTIGFQGIKQHRVIEDGSGFTSEEVEPLLYSTDINFRPVDLQFGPDGALYLVDWFNPLIGHMQYSLRDPRRDKFHGRIWRVVHEDRPLLPVVDLTALDLPELLDQLRAPEQRTRYRARRELRERDRDEAIAAVQAWWTALDAADPDFELARLEGLWALHNLDHVDADRLNEVLRSPEPRARAAALRVVRFWRDRLPEAYETLARHVGDDFPRARMEALLGLSFFTEKRSVPAALDVLDHPMDDDLDYVLGETLRTLRPWWLDDLDAALTERLDARQTERLLAELSTTELNDLPPSPALDAAALLRAEIDIDRQRRALERLGDRGTERLVSLLERGDREDLGTPLLERWARLLLERPVTELAELAERLTALQQEAARSPLRIAASAALTSAGEAPAARALETPTERVEALGRVRGDARTVAWERLRDALSASASALPPTRSLKIELPGAGRALALAEVEAFSGDRNVALGAATRESSTSQRGVGSRVVDGVLSGGFEESFRSTRERRPWLRIDMEGSSSLDRLVLHLADGTRFESLDDLEITGLDDRGRPTFRIQGIAHGRRTGRRVELVPATMARRASLLALAHLGVRPEETREVLTEALAASAPADALEALRRLTEDDPGLLEGDPAKRVAEALLEELEGSDGRRLTSADGKSLLALGERLASAEFDGRDDFARRLETLAPRVIRIEAVPHQMIFDLRSFSVKPGQTVEITLENLDVAPHNVVVGRPGTLDVIGREADDFALRNPQEAKNRGYVPRMDEILFASRLAQPSTEVRLVFEAPEDEGSYPYLCTFTGHWLTMNGTMIVSRDADADAEVERLPTAATAAVREFVRDWTLAELRSDSDRIDPPEQLDVESQIQARALMTDAGCLSCHRKQGEGREVGPALDGIAERYGATATLVHILEPSMSVAEEYETTMIELEDGRFFAGVLVDETESAVVLETNPLSGLPPERLAKDQIASRERSPLSPMPTGLLVTLDREEIVTLLRYLLWDPPEASP